MPLETSSTWTRDPPSSSAKVRNVPIVKTSFLYISGVLIYTVFIDPEFLLLDHPLVVADIDSLYGHPVLDFTILGNVDVYGIAEADVISTLLPIILAILLQTLCQPESTTLGSNEPLLMVLWDDMPGHIYAVAIGDNV